MLCRPPICHHHWCEVPDISPLSLVDLKWGFHSSHINMFVQKIPDMLDCMEMWGMCNGGVYITEADAIREYCFFEGMYLVCQYLVRKICIWIPSVNVFRKKCDGGLNKHLSLRVMWCSLFLSMCENHLLITINVHLLWTFTKQRVH